MAQQQKPVKRLYLSHNDKRLAGVCGGIGTFFDVDSTLIRLGWIIITAFSGLFPGLIAYIVAALVIPHEPGVAAAKPAPAETPVESRD